MHHTFTVFGNHGNITVNAITGAVLNLDEEDADEIGSYGDIVSFDVDEFRLAYPGERLTGTHVDIVDIGFWTDKGDYIAAEAEHRAIVRGERQP